MGHPLLLHATDPTFFAVCELQDASSTAFPDRTVSGRLPGSSSCFYQEAYISAARPGPESDTPKNDLQFATTRHFG